MTRQQMDNIHEVLLLEASKLPTTDLANKAMPQILAPVSPGCGVYNFLDVFEASGKGVRVGEVPDVTWLVGWDQLRIEDIVAVLEACKA